MTSMEGDSDPLGEALRRSLVQRVEELALGEARFGGYSPADRLEADKALEDRLVRRGRYHRFLSDVNAPLFFDRWAADDSMTTEEKFALLTRFIRGLSKVMLESKESRHPHSETLPAGYTYLFQFAAHDIVHSSSQALTFGDYSTPVLNLRREGLALETLFGGGPVACPFAFKSRKGKVPMGDQQIAQAMPLGETLANHGGPIPEKRDLLRDTYRLDKGKSEALGHVHIADVRNEDNFILAQFTALFHQYFNIILEKLANGDGEDRELRVQDLAMAVVRRVYRKIIKEDLLKKLLHKDVRDYYETGGDYIDAQSEFSVSREVAFAAVRVGHAMVREKYALNEAKPNIPIAELVKASSSRPPSGLNEIPDWAIDWRLFFKFEEKVCENFNFARRFSLTAVAGLGAKIVVVPPVLLDGTQLGPFGILARDLVRGATERLWSVPHLLERISQISPALGDAIGAGDKAALVKQTMQAAFAQHPEPAAVNAFFIDAVAKEIATEDPPLIAYLLAEAQQAPCGALGPLGSILIGEVFYRWLEPPAANPDEQKWHDLVEKKSKELHRELGEPESMSDLIVFITNCQTKTGA